MFLLLEIACKRRYKCGNSESIDTRFKQLKSISVRTLIGRMNIFDLKYFKIQQCSCNIVSILNFQTCVLSANMC